MRAKDCSVHSRVLVHCLVVPPQLEDTLSDDERMDDDEEKGGSVITGQVCMNATSWLFQKRTKELEKQGIV